MNPNQTNNNQMQNQQQTQVLNLNDVEQVAKEEKKASLPKKLAVCLFAVGILAIVGGFSYNSISSMLGLSTPEKANSEGAGEDGKDKESTSKAASVEATVDKSICQKTIPNQENGTDKEVTYELTYNEENKLQSYTKDMTMTPTTGNSKGPVTITKYKQGYTTIAGYKIPGYTLALTPTSNGTIEGLKVTVNIDLTNFDKAEYAKNNMMGDDVAQVELDLDATKEEVTQALTSNGFECK